MSASLKSVDPSLFKRSEETRDGMRRGAARIQLVAVAVLIASFVLFCFFQNLFCLCLTGLSLYGTSEMFTVGRNIVEITDDPSVEEKVLKSHQALLNQAGKKAPVAHLLFRAFLE